MRKFTIALFILGLWAFVPEVASASTGTSCTGTSVQDCHKKCIAPICRVSPPGTVAKCTYPDGPFTMVVTHTCGGQLQTPIKNPVPGEKKLPGE